jgi:hypothetical protein
MAHRGISHLCSLHFDRSSAHTVAVRGGGSRVLLGDFGDANSRCNGNYPSNAYVNANPPTDSLLGPLTGRAERLQPGLAHARSDRNAKQLVL